MQASSATEQPRQNVYTPQDALGLHRGEAEPHVGGVGPEAGPGGEEEALVDTVFEEALEPAFVEPLGNVEEQERAAARWRRSEPRSRCPTQLAVLLECDGLCANSRRSSKASHSPSNRP